MLLYTKILSIMYRINYYLFYYIIIIILNIFQKQSTVLNDSSYVVLGNLFFFLFFFKCLLKQNYNCNQNVCIQFIFCNFTARAVGMLAVS